MPYGQWDDKLLALTKMNLNHAYLLDRIAIMTNKRTNNGNQDPNQSGDGEDITPEGTANHYYLNIAILPYKFSTPPYPLFILIHLMLATLRTTAHTFCLPEEDTLLEGRSEEGENGGGAGRRKRRKTTETEDEKKEKAEEKVEEKAAKDEGTIKFLNKGNSKFPPSKRPFQHGRTRRKPNCTINQPSVTAASRARERARSPWRQNKGIFPAVYLSNAKLTRSRPFTERMNVEEKHTKGNEGKRKNMRSEAARKRRALKKKEKMKVKKLSDKMLKTGISAPPSADRTGAQPNRAHTPTQSQPTYTVQVRLHGVERPSEEDRRRVMAELALLISSMPSGSRDAPVTLRDSRIAVDRVLLVCGDSGSRDAVAELLAGRSDFTVTNGPVRRRFAFGGPGYLMGLPDGAIIGFLQNQNPDLPPGSLRLVSVNRGGRSVTAYVDVSEEGYAFLSERDFTLQTMTTPITLRPANGHNRSSQ